MSDLIQTLIRRIEDAELALSVYDPARTSEYWLRFESPNPRREEAISAAREILKETEAILLRGPCRCYREMIERWEQRLATSEEVLGSLMIVKPENAGTITEHVHSNECWEQDSGCDIGRNEAYVRVASPEVTAAIDASIADPDHTP